MNNLFNNIFKDFRTTILGLAISSISIYSIFVRENSSWGEITIPLLIGIALIIAPDSLIKIIKKFLDKNGGI